MLVNRLRQQEGFALVTTIGALVVFVAMTWFVVDFANWWVHKRHLQIQADAGALAGAGALAYPSCSDAVVQETAARYAGIGAGGVVFNPPGDVSTPADKLSWTFNEGLEEPSACASGIVDVWVQENDPPWFVRLPGLSGLDLIKAHARVQLKKQNVGAGMMPLGVEDVRPAKVHAWFYNLADGTGAGQPTVLGGADLQRRSDEAGVVYWDNATAPASVHVAKRVGVRIGVSRFGGVNMTDPSVCTTASGVDCYGLGQTGGEWSSLSTIRLKEPAGTAPTLDAVDLTGAGTGCRPTDNGYFSTGCSSVHVEAEVKGIDPSLFTNCSGNLSNKALVVTINGGCATRVGTTGSRWTRTLTLADGPNEISVGYTQRSGTVVGPPPTNTKACTAATPCTHTWSKAHRAFRGLAIGDEGDVPYAGPLREVQITDLTPDPVGLISSENNEPTGKCSAAGTSCSLVVEVGLAGYVSVAQAGDPPIAMRDSEGSQTGLMDCGDGNLRDQIRTGCTHTFAINDGDPDCPSTYQNAAAVLASPQPHECVGPRPTDAGAVGQLSQGLNDRIQCRPFGIECTNGTKPTCESLNNWPNYGQGDARIIQVFLVPNGSLDGQGGSTTFPVTGFAAFYVTGYSSNPCKGDVDGDGDDDNDLGGLKGNGELIAGHWITDIEPNLNGGSDAACNLSAIDSCVAVMTE